MACLARSRSQALASRAQRVTTMANAADRGTQLEQLLAQVMDATTHLRGLVKDQP